MIRWSKSQRSKGNGHESILTSFFDRGKNRPRLKTIADDFMIAYEIRIFMLGRDGAKELIERHPNRFSIHLGNVCDFGVIGLCNKNVEKYKHEKLQDHQLIAAPPLLPVKWVIKLAIQIPFKAEGVFSSAMVMICNKS